MEPEATRRDARPDDSPAVELDGVSKRYRSATALDDLSLQAPRSQITVLLGPNGAGKTTALRTMTGAIPADGGLVRTFGLDPQADGETVRRRCGVVAARPALYDRLDGRDNLRYAATLYGIDDDVSTRIVASAARFGIDHALDTMVSAYSTGMRTRLALARAVLHEPELLLLDEPTSGLDPESSRAVLALIRELTDDGRTVVMSTHLLAEAEGLADQIVIMDEGTDLMQGPQTDLVHRYWPGVFVRFDAEDPAGLDVLSRSPGVRSYVRNGHAICEVDNASTVPDLVHLLTGRGVRLTHVSRHVPSLEDLYFRARDQHHAAGASPGIGAHDPVEVAP